MNIVVGVTGGIAAYKTVLLVRSLVSEGHEVHVIPTDAALRFVGAPTWEAISRHPVTTSVHDDVPEVRHVALGQRADLVIVAPATANTIATMAAGIADDLLGTTLLATRAPVVVAPAMHTEMWLHPATQANIDTLRSRGVHVVGPDEGRLTGDDSGPGRMSEPETIRDMALGLVRAGQHGQSREHSSAAGDDLTGLRVLVSAGGTREPLDPVRFLGNRSSGKQGVAIAAAAARRGARVRLVAAHITDEVLGDARRAGVEIEQAGTARDVGAAMTAHAGDADVIVMAAAVADYSPVLVHDHKITKEGTAGVPPTIQLSENPDILVGLVSQRRDGQTIVGFAAETPAADESLRERAIRKRRRKGCDLLVANAVGWTTGFEHDENTVIIVDAADSVVAEAAGSKSAVAEAVLDAVITTREPAAR